MGYLYPYNGIRPVMVPPKVVSTDTVYMAIPPFMAKLGHRKMGKIMLINHEMERGTLLSDKSGPVHFRVGFSQFASPRKFHFSAVRLAEDQALRRACNHITELSPGAAHAPNRRTDQGHSQGVCRSQTSCSKLAAGQRMPMKNEIVINNVDPDGGFKSI